MTEQITYLPGEEDPPKVLWNGITFYANMPRAVSDPRMIEQARANPFFHVGAFDPDKHSVKLRAQTKEPKTPEQYRAHAVAWLNKVESVADLDARWAREEVLRIQCGVGADDLDFLSHLFRPKRGELEKRDKIMS